MVNTNIIISSSVSTSSQASPTKNRRGSIDTHQVSHWLKDDVCNIKFENLPVASSVPREWADWGIKHLTSPLYAPWLSEKVEVTWSSWLKDHTLKITEVFGKAKQLFNCRRNKVQPITEEQISPSMKIVVDSPSNESAISSQDSNSPKAEKEHDLEPEHSQISKVDEAYSEKGRSLLVCFPKKYIAIMTDINEKKDSKLWDRTTKVTYLIGGLLTFLAGKFISFNPEDPFSATVWKVSTMVFCVGFGPVLGWISGNKKTNLTTNCLEKRIKLINNLEATFAKLTGHLFERYVVLYPFTQKLASRTITIDGVVRDIERQDLARIGFTPEVRARLEQDRELFFDGISHLLENIKLIKKAMIDLKFKKDEIKSIIGKFKKAVTLINSEDAQVKLMDSELSVYNRKLTLYVDKIVSELKENEKARVKALQDASKKNIKIISPGGPVDDFADLEDTKQRRIHIQRKPPLPTTHRANHGKTKPKKIAQKVLSPTKQLPKVNHTPRASRNKRSSVYQEEHKQPN